MFTKRRHRVAVHDIVHGEVVLAVTIKQHDNPSTSRTIQSPPVIRLRNVAVTGCENTFLKSLKRLYETRRVLRNMLNIVVPGFIPSFKVLHKDRVAMGERLNFLPSSFILPHKAVIVKMSVR